MVSDDFVVGLAGVEIVGELVDDIVVAAGHGVPPLDLDHRMRWCRGSKGQRDGGCQNSAELSKSHQIPPVGSSSSFRAFTARGDVQMTV